MDGWGIAIFVISVIVYFATNRKYRAFLFTAGIGAGILIGAVWAYLMVSSLASQYFP